MTRPDLPPLAQGGRGDPEPPPSKVGTWDLPVSRLHVLEQ